MSSDDTWVRLLTGADLRQCRSSATAFTEDGVIDGSGKETKVEVIICPTGFETTKPSYKIIGRNNRDVGEVWGEFPKAYMSIMSDGFPNLFCKYP
jgi:cation diffusion facilitator CzcD-associated flavoprotein CzcO